MSKRHQQINRILWASILEDRKSLEILEPLVLFHRSMRNSQSICPVLIPSTCYFLTFETKGLGRGSYSQKATKQEMI
jgi:hypothetical protein